MTTLERCLGPGQLRVYLALCRMHDRGEHVTYRSLAARAGVAFSRVQKVLPILVRAGLVSTCPGVAPGGRFGVVTGSIRPMRPVALFSPECFGPCPATPSTSSGTSAPPAA